MDQRLDDLSRWASAEIKRFADAEISANVETVSGDASFRRYFRMTFRDRSWILVDAPPAHEDCGRFIRIATAWHKAGVRVPGVIAVDTERGFMLLEDFGNQLLWGRLHREGIRLDEISGLYQVAIDQLLHLQSVKPDALPPYDATLLYNEMALFRDWLCQKQLAMELTDAELELLESVFQTLIANILAQPVVTVHRDYHSRNLMVLSDNELGIIDFQDAVAGAPTYDLMSLLRDSYVRWPTEVVDELMAYYWQKARQQGVYLGGWEQLVQDADWMGLQRQIKVAGIFARLNLRDGKAAYLADIPNTVRYLRDAAGRYEEFAPFCQWLDKRFLPALAQLSEQP
ncbi:aminoglycoside phosphotransferase family protein [Parathalassolituus penaei]|uniref:Phosphotransferase n=1 Tax=Parathalassolituus penaei TaxID=2997323 RepID=A0A9X3EAU3_9GAMM|nr:phosphotransferase [Parathalassolituus penaei]MCY0963810.1 phosphotransferase [Parathalassolituus penaei]